MRLRRRRRLHFKPHVLYFKPQGIRMSSLQEIVLRADELEALKLYQIDGLDQIQAAQRMAISQPTFARTLACAHKKVAEAIILGKAIRIEKAED